MAWIVGDGFDYYQVKDDLARSVWDSAVIGGYNMLAAASTRFAFGQGLSTATAQVFLTKTHANEPILYVAVAHYRPGALSGTTPELYFTFRDGATAQSTVVFESSGAIVLKSGIQTGTVLATYAAAFPQDVWNHFQIRVVINATTGAITVRKNGAATDSFTATGLNTRGGTANNYANVLAVGTGNGAVFTRFDDLLVYAESGVAPNTWVGDVRAIPLQPVADVAVALTPTPSATATWVSAGASGTATVATNVIMWSATTPTRGGSLTQVVPTQSGTYTGHVKAALYASDGTGGGPGTLLGVSNELTNPVAGAVTFTFSPSIPVASGRVYWVGYHSDAAWTATGSAGPPANSQTTLARAYASGFPDPAGAPGPATAQAPSSTATVTGNAVTVSEPIANSDTDYVFSATVSQQDLYAVADLPLVPASIIGVVSKGFLKKSDAGARSGQLIVKSGATEVTTPDAGLATTYTYVARVDTVDPATGTAWTKAGVDALQIGARVTA